MTDTNKWVEALRDRELKATTNRVEVLNSIEIFGRAMPYSKIQETLSAIDRVTLYRTLNSLIESGLIHKVSVDDNDTYYAICSKQCTTQEHNHQHVHFKCSVCGSVTCVHSKGIEQLNLPGYAVESFEIQAVGICPNCI